MVITDYKYEKNTYSDSQFLKDSLKWTPAQKEKLDLAAKKNIQFVNTGLSGKPVDDILVYFVFNQERTKVLECPAGYAPQVLWIHERKVAVVPYFFSTGTE